MSHDHAYKQFFSHPDMVKDLLQGFVHEHWIVDIDFSTLERVNGSYIADDLRERANDLIWRVKFKNKEEWLYLYLLLEFQSSIDRFMAVRLMTYVGLLYQDLIKSKQLPTPGKLPPVFPIVLYNGERRWKASTQLSDLIQSVPPDLAQWQPEQRYMLIEEHQFSDEELKPLKNLAAALFRLENSDNVEQLAQVIGSLVKWLKKPQQDSLRQAFVEWLKQGPLQKLSHHSEPLETLNDLHEVQQMLSKRVDQWVKQWKSEGYQEGVAKGEVNALRLVLQSRFGDLPSWVDEKLIHADQSSLNRWLLRASHVDNLESLFK
ncbi:Rpn family recombination-promoting nuclease/putative transposase [Endozoicomonas sp. SM1973]|uniref:Rpn family recombination-promoting nuclease/putative transposase n=1 Tax=Spartinivicinus marinus TaxID=2994442 RepID=A0A853IIK1_9GAMM|nr:Rpn family recombination-promoting nuclease/putative transposase [Spartinivicinus marinus]MCX4030290.1 Rpn family recombination-promoting nuclease/putative transposase [Spartinivicinus marinus]NYZ69901.1 Rpn family recombination-promoting nuclease/putative transposase [Spartinivicinus marinus]